MRLDVTMHYQHVPSARGHPGHAAPWCQPDPVLCSPNRAHHTSKSHGQHRIPPQGMWRLEEPPEKQRKELSPLLGLSVLMQELPVHYVCKRRELLSAVLDKHCCVVLVPNSQLTHRLFILCWYLVSCLDVHSLELGACILEAVFKQQQHPSQGLALGCVRAEQNKTVWLEWKRFSLLSRSILGEEKGLVGAETNPGCVREFAWRGWNYCWQGVLRLCIPYSSRQPRGPLLGPCPETIFSLPGCGWEGSAPGKLVWGCGLLHPSPGCIPACIPGLLCWGRRLQLWQLVSCSQCLILNPFGGGSFTAYCWYFSHRIPD